MGKKTALFIISNVLLGEFVVTQIPLILCSSRLEVMVSRKRNASPRQSARDPFNFELRPHCGLLLPRDQQGGIKFTIFLGIIDLDHEEEVGLLSHNGSRKKYVRHPNYPLGYLLVLPCTILMIHG